MTSEFGDAVLVEEELLQRLQSRKGGRNRREVVVVEAQRPEAPPQEPQIRGNVPDPAGLGFFERRFFFATHHRGGGVLVVRGCEEREVPQLPDLLRGAPSL